MGLGFGFRPVRSRAVHDGPATDRFEQERWLPMFFSKLAQRLRDDRGLLIPLTAYLDARVEHLDGAYLKVQVALEAFSRLLVEEHLASTKKPTVLVRDTAKWLKWVEAHRDEIARHAWDEEAAEKLLNKTGQAMQRPATDAVTNALQLAPALALPDDLLEEIRGRNTAVHRFLMARTTEPRDLQEDVRRLARMETVLVALLARHIGYAGPIAGWSRSPAGWRITPEWWSVSASARADASEYFVCHRRKRP